MKKFKLLLICLISALMLTACDINTAIEIGDMLGVWDSTGYSNVSADDIPDYSGKGTIIINNNEPYFDDSELVANSFEYYSDLDRLGRCGPAYACLGRDLMPIGERGSISSVKPSGWQSVQYDFVESKSLYNRSHLIGWQLAGENANEKNLITGTRYLNAALMLPYENMVADYIKETDNHVLYRITPYFEGNNLVAKGVLMEAKSVEDDGDGICYNVFCYNVQPGVEIDYSNGKSREIKSANGVKKTYILNTGTKKFHLPSCKSVSDIGSSKRQEYKGTRENLILQGYKPCGSCNP